MTERDRNGFVDAILTSENKAAQNVFREAREIGKQRRWEGEDSDRKTTMLAQNAICTIAENGLRVGYDTGYAAALTAERQRVEKLEAMLAAADHIGMGDTSIFLEGGKWVASRLGVEFGEYDSALDAYAALNPADTGEAVCETEDKT